MSDLDFLYFNEAVEFARCKESRLRSAVYYDEIPYYKNGRKVIFKKEDVLNWVLGDKEKVTEEQERNTKQQHIGYKKAVIDTVKELKYWIKHSENKETKAYLRAVVKKIEFLKSLNLQNRELYQGQGSDNEG